MGSQDTSITSQLKKAGYQVDKYDGELENIRVTNDYFNKLKVIEYCSFYCATIGMGSSMISYEFEAYYLFNKKEQTDLGM